MKAMIFAAGLGTRLKPWTDHHPKALAIVNGKSLLQRNVEYLQENGIKDVVVNVHHFADQIEDAIRENNGWGSNIIISDEREEVLETGGGLLFAQHLLEGKEAFVTVNADILTNLPINELLEFHNNKEALISFAVSKRETSRQFLFNKDMQLCGWRNRLTQEEKGPLIINPTINRNELVEWAYGCVVVFSPEFFKVVKEKGKFSLTESYLSLANEYKVIGWPCEPEKWIDVGKPESIQKASEIFT